METMQSRINAIKSCGSLTEALASETLKKRQDITASEFLLLGLLNQGVRKFIGVFGHGTTTLGEVMRCYQEAGIISVYNVRSEIEASHIAAALLWRYNERSAVFTSIGPGGLQALAASILPLSNRLGIYYIIGDETTWDEGFNMQQIPRHEQNIFLKLFSVIGSAYSLHTAEAIPSALKRGIGVTADPVTPSPFFLLFPMNIQPKMIVSAPLHGLPIPPFYKVTSVDENPAPIESAAEAIKRYARITVKVGAGALDIPQQILMDFLKVSGAVLVHGPSSSGLLPWEDPLNMGVGGSKGSLSGNFAMEECDLLIAIGARGVCQWDCSKTGWLKARGIITINARYNDAIHYNHNVPLIGDAALLLRRLTEKLRTSNVDSKGSSQWHEECAVKKREWIAFREERLQTPLLMDDKWKREILTQPAAIARTLEFTKKHNLPRFFDAGDVQANGFQLADDECAGQTYTDSGASYMGFAASAVVASGIAEEKDYIVAFTGDGSFMMSPQVLIDAVQYKAKGMIVVFDNRRMSAISSLQKDQFGRAFATDDSVEVDYAALANAVKGVRGIFGGYDLPSLDAALEEAYAYDGLSVVHIPVYFGDHPLGGLGAFGRWNVGNWCGDVQELMTQLGF